MRHIRLLDSGCQTVLFSSIGILNIGLGNSRNYLTIGYRIKPQSNVLSDIGLRKNYRLLTSGNRALLNRCLNRIWYGLLYIVIHSKN
jgi:hypothetical protein